MKRNKIIAFLLLAAMIISMLPVVAAAEETTAWRTIYVSPSGSDTADGSQNAPFKTLARAQEAVRAINSNMQGDIVVNIAKGEYYLEEGLQFRKEDSGKNGYKVIWKGIDRPLITGAEKVTGWTASTDHPGLYETTVDDEDRIMQIYVNGKKRYMSRSNNFVKGVVKPEQYRSVQWYADHPKDMEGDDYNWYDPETNYSYDGFYMSKNDIGFWENEDDIIFEWERDWKTQLVCVEDIIQDPDNADQVKVRMERGFWQILVSCNYTGQAMYPEGGVRFRILNAMELLDEPGEFYFNRATKKLYYMPVYGEDMSTAEVHIPKNDIFATIYGNDYNDCVKNIEFTGLDISYYASDGVAEGYWGEQGSVVRGASGTQGVGRSGVLMYFCDNVNFYDNYFRGFDMLAINMQQGVYNCTVRGNAFSDIGDAAINIGAERHMTVNSGDVPSNQKKLSILSDPFRYAIYSSYVGDDWVNMTNHIYAVRAGGSRPNSASINYVPNSGYNYKGMAWHSDPVDAANGERSYMMFDLYTKYDISDIVLCWDDSLVSTEEKSNYEVLMSNDKSFAEGTYVTVASQNGAYQGEVAEYAVNDSNRYRYVMIRTKGATKLALSTVYILTSEMKPYVYSAKPKNITIDNNYMTRIGVEIPRACAVMAYYIDGLTLTNNYLYNIGYSGMEIGWGWSPDNKNTTNVYCAYNHIERTNQFLHDGGPIYTLSRQPGSIYEYNYTTGNIMGVHTIYQDSGSASIIWRHNVAEDCQYIVSPYYDGYIIDNTYYSNYGTHTKSHLSTNALRDNSYEEVIPYAIGLPTEEPFNIIANAGLEKEYKYLVDLVPTGVDNGWPEEGVGYERVDDVGWSATYSGMHKAEVDNVVALANFGNDFGTYPKALEQRFLDMAANYTATATNRNTVIMRSMMRELRDSVNRYSLDETVNFIREELDNARTISEDCPCLATFALAGLNDTFGMMTAEDVARFRERLAVLESNMETVASPYRLQLEAESLYNDVMSSKFSADITYVSTEGMAGYSIDPDAKNITIYFEKGSSMADKALSITCTPGSTLAVKLPATVDLSKTIIVPVYCSKNLSYKYWTIQGAYYEPETADYTANESWVSLRSGSENTERTADGGIVIKHSPFANMSKAYDKNANGASFKMTPMSYLPNKNFTFVFGANGTEIDNTLTGTVVDRMEIVFENALASLYLVKGGNRTLIKQANTTLAYNTANDVSYKVEKQGSQTVVSFSLNGEQVFNEMVSAQLESAYFGFNSDKISIKINE